MNTIAKLEEQSRLAVVAYLSDMDNVELECTPKCNPAYYPADTKLNWYYNHFPINLGNTWYRIAPKTLWYKVALCSWGREYYTTTANSDAQILQCETNPNFINWLTPNKVYYSAEKESK